VERHRVPESVVRPDPVETEVLAEARAAHRVEDAMEDALLREGGVVRLPPQALEAPLGRNRTVWVERDMIPNCEFVACGSGSGAHVDRAGARTMIQVSGGAIPAKVPAKPR
jgi:hypothetical protein